MLVINERTTAPQSEQRVLNWMRTWTGQYVIVGLAISGCYLPERDREDETQEADLVVITPRAAIVIEVKGAVPEATTGVLSVQANGRWRLSGFAGDPIHVRDHDSSPFDQVTSNVFNLKALVRKHNAEAFVDGLIVVVPPKDSNLTLNVESRRRGCGVVLGTTPVDLRAWFHRTASRKLIWTAERTHALLTDLNLGDQVTVDDLVADGFPPEQKLRAGTLAALESVTRKTRPVDGRATAVEISETDDSSEGSDSPPSELASESSDVVPVAAQLTASSSMRSAEMDDGPVEVSKHAPESDRSTPPLSAIPARTRTDAAEPDASEPDISESEVSQPGPSMQSDAESGQQADAFSSTVQQPLEYVDVSDDIRVVYASESHPAQDAPAARVVPTRPAEPDPFAPEFLAPEPAAFEPASSSATVHPDQDGREETHHTPPAPAYAQSRVLADEPEDDAAERASKPPRSEGRLAATPDPVADSAHGPSFTDNWSSWIESAPDRPLRPRPAPASSPSRPASWSTPSPEPQPLRRSTPTAVIERRPRIADLRRITALPARTSGRAAEKSQPRGHRSQQIAAVALIALVIGTIWILAASCSTPTGGAVQQPQAPVSATEVVSPPPTVTETPARLNLLPLCTPVKPKC
ncbi:NERD domain-containing protein [Nocardia abscessus]|uniref:NERD domain-containing protein n=1 Tax=Nocardia abscessus TaxID=120957 RepID=UPI00245459BB|nr:NERD domain-containing protein [Nocardia abscessus]